MIKIIPLHIFFHSFLSRSLSSHLTLKLISLGPTPSQPLISLRPTPSQPPISLNSLSQLRSLNSHRSSTHQSSQLLIASNPHHPSRLSLSNRRRPSRLSLSIHSLNSSLSTPTKAQPTSRPIRPSLSDRRHPSRHLSPFTFSTPTEARPTSRPSRRSPQTHTVPTNPYQVSCLYHFVVDACDFWFRYNIKEWVYDQRMWDFLFGYNIKECVQWFLFLVLSVYYYKCNNFFAVLAQWKVLSFDLKASIFFLFKASMNGHNVFVLECIGNFSFAGICCVVFL